MKKVFYFFGITSFIIQIIANLYLVITRIADNKQTANMSSYVPYHKGDDGRIYDINGNLVIPKDEITN